MNKIEKLIYDFTKSTPWLKFILRNIYQTIFDILPKKKEYSINKIYYKQNYFFGFHDKTTFSVDCKKVLANHLTIKELRMPNRNEYVDIGYFKFANSNLNEFIKLDKSYAWNYHKGCRLQWVDNNTLIFNTALDQKLVSKTINIQSLHEKIIDYPIDTVSEDGKWATSFSYERLEKLMPGYGYNYSDDGYLNENTPKETGLFIVDLNKNTRRLLISLSELVSDITDNPNIKDFKHYITHTEFSSNSRYISFLHRWISKDVRDRKTRLIIFDLTKKNYFVIPTEGMVSHYIWNKKDQIIAYCKKENADCHVLFNIPNVNNYKMIAPEQLNSDGHQSFISNTEFITDTYPDKYRIAKLHKVNIEKDEVQLLASLYSPKLFQTKDFRKHIACDLHPRVSPNGKYVSFDSVRNDQRSFCIMQLPKSIK